MQRLADQIPALGRDVVVLFPENEHQFGVREVLGAGQAVVGFVQPERVRVQVGCEVGDCGGDAGVEGGAVGEVAA